MMISNMMKRVAAGGVVVAAALATSAVLALPASADTPTLPIPGNAGFGQIAAAPVNNTAPIHQLVGSVGAPFINVNIPCPAPWNQGGVLGAKYNACSTAPVDQHNGPEVPGGPTWTGGGTAGFGQIAAAPVNNSAPIHQLVGSVGAPFINVNIPCPAPWWQGGVLGAKYNACNTAPVRQ